MTTIDRLGITGIRSYGRDEATISFGHPLTIILGRNGSGKSTIIESIKMATTGDLPPMVGTGAAFIHDPRIDNETETKAKIRLQFTNARGDKYVVSRHFVLSIKRARGKLKTEFKRLDQSLKRTPKSGESSTSSFRCGNLNTLLPEIMRVSKPILNNVIFVHQEDSLWPLGDPKKLKEKFDDIFAATRYTKALDSIRKFRKDQAVNLKLISKDLEHFQEKVQKLDELQLEADQLRDRQKKLSRGGVNLKEEMNALAKERDAAQAIADRHNTKINERDTINRDIEALERQKNEICLELTEHFKSVDDLWLKDELAQFQEKLKDVEGVTADRNRDINVLRNKQEALEVSLRTKNAKLGKLQEQHRLYEVDRKNLEDMKTTLIERNEINSSSSLSVDLENEKWSVALREVIRDSEQSLNSIRDECQKAEDAAMGKYNETVAKFNSAQGNLRDKKKRIAVLEADMPAKRNAIRAMGDVRAKYQEAKEKEEIAQKEYTERKASKISKELKEKIESKSSEIKGLTKKLEDCRDLRKDLESDSRAREEVNRYRKGVQEKKKDLISTVEVFRDTILAAVREVRDAEALVQGYVAPSDSYKFEDLRGIDTSEDDIEKLKEELEDAYRAITDRKKGLMRFLEEDWNKSSSELSGAKTRESELKRQLTAARSSLGRREKDLGKARDKLISLPRPKNYASLDEELADLFQKGLVVSDNTACNMTEEQINTLDSKLQAMDKKKVIAFQNVTLAGSIARYWKHIIRRFEEDPSAGCPVCGIATKKREQSQREHMNEELLKAQNPEKDAEMKDQAEKLKGITEAVKNVRDIASNVVSLSETFLPLKSSYVEAETKLKECEECFGKGKEMLNKIKIRLGDDSDAACSKLDGLAGDVERIKAELRSLLSSLSSAEDKLPAGSRNQRSMEDVINEITDLEQTREGLQEDIAKLTKRVNKEYEEIQRSSHRHNSAMQESRELQKMGAEFEKLEREMEKMKQEVKELDKVISELEPVVKQEQNEVEASKSNLDNVRRDQGGKLRAATDKHNSTAQIISEFDKLLEKISSFESRGQQNALNLLLQQIQSTEEEFQGIKTDLEKLQKEAADGTNNEQGIEKAIRNLKMNLKVREKDEQITSYREKMEGLQAEVNRIKADSQDGNPQAVVDVLNHKISNLRITLEQTKTKHTMLTDQYKEKKKKLEEAEAQGSRNEYDKCRISKQTMALASSDLDKYHRALDQALMAFHTLKMNSINRIIKELWQQTYRGTDIDEIEIGSDAGDALGGTTAGKRSYNYRVMMRQGQAQLDMRGRCSAGQKVLACLVIRLALAESFCTDCGILALDEPTTNLDTENIESLANALKAIIELRRKQVNFQLLLITHDRDFIEMMGARNFADEVFMVFKDAKGVSKANLVPLSELPE